MAGFTDQPGGRCGPVVHRGAAKRARIFVTVRAFIARQPCQRRRNVIARLDYDTNITGVVTSLASSRADMIEAGHRTPVCFAMAGVATGCRRHMVGRLVIHSRITDQMARRA